MTELNEFVKEALPIVASYIHYWTTVQHHSTVIKTFFKSFATMKNTSIFLLHGIIWKPDKGSCDPIGGAAKRNADFAVKQQKAVIQDANDSFCMGQKSGFQHRILLYFYCGV